MHGKKSFSFFYIATRWFHHNFYAFQREKGIHHLFLLTDDLMVAVPYGNAEHRADVEVRELVCLKTHWEEFSAQRQLFSVFWRKKKKCG